MKQILIVEDDSFLNKMLDYNLTADGYGVTSALNARTAADAIRQREFDLVLLDINLPDGNGFELCKLIKPQHPDTIVIFLTANDQESDQIRGYEVGAVDYILYEVEDCRKSKFQNQGNLRFLPYCITQLHSIFHRLLMECCYMRPN